MAVVSLLAHLIDWMSTMSTPTLSMFLMATITVDEAYIPAKASIESGHGVTKQKAVKQANSTVATSGSTAWPLRGMKVS